MEIEIKFNEVFNVPTGTARPRFRKTGRYAHTRENSTEHKKYLQNQMPKKLNLENALKIELDFYFPLS